MSDLYCTIGNAGSKQPYESGGTISIVVKVASKPRVIGSCHDGDSGFSERDLLGISAMSLLPYLSCRNAEILTQLLTIPALPRF